ncbi:MAG: hypothetical protein ACFFD4_14510 [Candidatus Odinarchaeota archaeon]
MTVALVEELANQLLELEPAPAVRFRLLRDVLRVSNTDGKLEEAKRSLLSSKWITELQAGQLADGSWGRFHSANTAVKKRIVTTEHAVSRGLALGLESGDGIFQKTADYLVNLLNGKKSFPDPPEKNERWTTGTRLFTAATLAVLQPGSTALNSVHRTWIEIARRTFISGVHDPEQELLAHRECTGMLVEDNCLYYLVLHNKYTIALLGARIHSLPGKLEKKLVSWLWGRQEGMQYLGIPPAWKPAGASANQLEHWFQSQELLARFPSWKALAGDTVEWLWNQQKEDGYWDFGKRISHPDPGYFPLSESWRNERCRKIDWTVRTLVLLRNFYD